VFHLNDSCARQYLCMAIRTSVTCLSGILTAPTKNICREQDLELRSRECLQKSHYHRLTNVYSRLVGSIWRSISDEVDLCCAAKPATVELNRKARLPAYLFSLTYAPELLDEHNALYKKKVYSSSAQLTSQHTPEELQASLVLLVHP
jgi:hypothetical protein